MMIISVNVIIFVALMGMVIGATTFDDRRKARARDRARKAGHPCTYQLTDPDLPAPVTRCSHPQERA